MSITGIFNFIAIDDRTATAGQPTPDQFKDVRDEGYEAVVNLLPHTQDKALQGEDAIVRNLNMTYHYIPVVWTNPRAEDFAQFCDVMQTLDSRRIFIHCMANFRVTAFYSAYAMKTLGWSGAKADELVQRAWTVRGESRMNDTWRAFIETIRK
jgi:protein tyrosine phosphatase (PTP) superfamily phosphohydrolase (DUF442 family)